MNKRYIDFVPAKKSIPKGGIAKAKSIKVTKPAEKPLEKPVKKPVKRIVRRIPAANPLLDEEIEVEEIFAEREEPKKAPKSVVKPKLTRDNQPKFVKADVKKRPLGSKNAVKVAGAAKVGVTAAKAKTAVKGAAVAKTATAAKVATSVKPAAAKPVAKRPAPLGQRTKFLNTDKIEKRPLSTVTARKKPVIVPKPIEEKPKAPERIISKPEKDSKAGLIIAIILTIILGAAAGTVAFLLLPK